MLSSSLSLTAQTAFSQVVEVALTVEHMRSVADFPGAFVPKTVKGQKYWYYQDPESAGVRRQVFVGPEGEAVQTLIARAGQPAAAESLGPLAHAAVVLGCAEVLSRHYWVLRRLGESGFFRQGAC